MSDPIDHAKLAALLRVVAPSGRPVRLSADVVARLREYVDTAEDTIAEQSRQMAIDAEDLAARRRVRREQSDVIGIIGAECERLKTEVATLRQLAEAALIAGMRRDDVDLNLVRQALEKTR